MFVFLYFCCLSEFFFPWLFHLLLDITYFIMCSYILYALFNELHSHLNPCFRENNDRFFCTCSMFSKFPIHFGVKQQQASLQSLRLLMCSVLLSRQQLNYMFHKQVIHFFPAWAEHLPFIRKNAPRGSSSLCPRHGLSFVYIKLFNMLLVVQDGIVLNIKNFTKSSCFVEMNHRCLAFPRQN